MRARAIENIRALAQKVGEERFIEVLDEFNVPSLREFDSVDQLTAVTNALQANAQVAA